MVTLMPNHQAADRARPVVFFDAASLPTFGSWHSGSVASVNGSTTGVATPCTAFVNPITFTDGATDQTTKRPARHLETRST